MILELECLFYQNIYIISSYFIFVEPLTQTNPKKGLIEKKHTI